MSLPTAAAQVKQVKENTVNWDRSTAVPGAGLQQLKRMVMMMVVMM
jgi:hypothetical protein